MTNILASAVKGSKKVLLEIKQIIDENFDSVLEKKADN